MMASVGAEVSISTPPSGNSAFHAQAKVSAWQDRLAYINLTLAILAAFGGIMASS